MEGREDKKEVEEEEEREKREEIEERKRESINYLLAFECCELCILFTFSSLVSSSTFFTFLPFSCFPFSNLPPTLRLQSSGQCFVYEVKKNKTDLEEHQVLCFNLCFGHILHCQNFLWRSFG